MNVMGKITQILVMLSLIIFGCNVDEENPVTTGSTPTIEKINMQDKWNTLSSNKYKIEVHVNDPQGLSNISRVIMTVRNSSLDIVFEDSLYDDGSFYNKESGDVFAGDGVYSNRYRPLDITGSSDEEEYTFQFIVIDEQNNEGQVLDEPVVMGPNSRPQILAISVPDTLPTDYSDAIFSITVADSNGIDDILMACFESENLQENYTKFEENLYNDGDLENHGDAVAGDSIYSIRVSPGFVSGKQGLYDLYFYVQDSYNERNVDTAKSTIRIINWPPVFGDITLPQSINVPVSGFNQALMTAVVSDPEGLTDIDSVYFYSVKPDSSLANSGFPFILVDNGLSFNINNPLIEAGDLTAGDGVYSFTLIVDSNTTPGTYRFRFFIRDKAGNLAGPEVRTLNIISN